MCNIDFKDYERPKLAGKNKLIILYYWIINLLCNYSLYDLGILC